MIFNVNVTDYCPRFGATEDTLANAKWLQPNSPAFVTRCSCVQTLHGRNIGRIRASRFACTCSNTKDVSNLFEVLVLRHTSDLRYEWKHVVLFHGQQRGKLVSDIRHLSPLHLLITEHRSEEHTSELPSQKRNSY